jgi:hypothetical protein
MVIVMLIDTYIYLQFDTSHLLTEFLALWSCGLSVLSSVDGYTSLIFFAFYVFASICMLPVC